MKSRSTTAMLVLLGALMLTGPFVGAHGQTLTVHVEDGQTGAPLPGAFVMVGLAEGLPFPGNIEWTDATGAARFTHPLLAAPQTVSAAAEDFGVTTLFDAAIGELTIPLYPAAPDSTLGGLRTQVEGQVTHMETSPNDGNFDIAVILPALPASSYALQDDLPYIITIEDVDFPLIGTLPLPSNVYMPDQVEFGFFHFSKSPYRIEIPGDRRVTFVAISARVAIVDLLGGTAPQNAVIREVGAERGIAVPHPGPFTRDVASDLGLSNDLTVQLYDTPDGADLQAASAAVILEDGRERIVGYDTRGDLPLRATEFELATRAPSGDLGDAENIAVGTCVDSSAAREWSLGIFDRSGFTPPYTAVFDSWMRVPELERSGHLYRWSDPTNPGSSPSPTWTRSNLGLRPIDPTDSTVAITVDWRIYTRAYPRRFNLPVLPAIAPVPPGGLPDPGATPDEDQLYWFFVAVNSPGDTQSILRDFMQDGTHWVSHWMPLEPDQAIEPAEESVPRLLLEAAPRPTFGLVRFTWTQPAAGDGSLTIVGCDGRPVIRVPVDLGRGVHVWNGRDAQGRRAPGGVYWATLSGHDQPPARIRILRLE